MRRFLLGIHGFAVHKGQSGLGTLFAAQGHPLAHAQM